MNLYAMMGNDAVNGIDLLGLKECKCCPDTETGTPYNPATQGCCVGKIYTLSSECCCKDKGIVFSKLAILQEKVKIIRLSHRWNKTSPTWSWNNQCYEQSTALKAHLGAFHKYWNIFVEGHKGLILNHHVVVVSFKCINSDCGQSDFVIDPLKYFSPGTFLVQNPEQAELLLDTYTNISVYSYQSFTSDYPNPLTPLH
jgi:hypothetical protein